MISKIIAILVGFVSRVVFTHTLNESYVGINGLFSDILNVLSLSELGIGTAITYALYRPIAEHEIEKQKSLMRLYRWMYRMVAGFILAAGLAVVPFLDVLIKNKPDVEHLTGIYLMYLANSVLSYLLIYKKTLIDAHQKLYLGVIYETVFLVLQNVIQIIILLWTGDFILYLTIYLLCTLGKNLCISHKADRLYPYIREKQVQPLEKEEKREILRNMKAMLMHKAGHVVVNNTDNLLLSSLVGISSVSCYSIYYLLIGSVRQIFTQMFQGIMASVGNLGVTESRQRVKRIFEASFFIGYWMYGFAAVCLYELLNPFVEFCFGAQFVFDRNVVLVLCMNFYVTGMRQATLIFRDSLGLFWYDRYKSIAEGVINLVVSIVLAQKLGAAGVFIGTLVSSLTTSVWVEPWVLYRRHLQEPVMPYFRKYAGYTAVLGLAGLIVELVCSKIPCSSPGFFLLRACVCIVFINSIFFICYHRTKEFRLLVQKWKSLRKRT